MCRALCEPATLRVSSFTQIASTCLERIGQRRGGCERRHDKAVAVDPRHLVVQITHEIDIGLVAHAVGSGEVISVKKTAPAHERVRLRDYRAGRPAG